ncbi:DUF4190 domain-containing protein [Cellulomonas edaphi]|uniref:DUF4190 domain-containing protein n=1 Tax=Cellulomonas edaphi TaxID=3053468 RepID=A0ABT7S3Z5_9CELL|nr:DUF4190 domain-containing protein [Cellulomons edaphi]MDM7830342.1 DUF4190 domain-containing protein [Cellulomons edaphi]
MSSPDSGEAGGSWPGQQPAGPGGYPPPPTPPGPVLPAGYPETYYAPGWQEPKPPTDGVSIAALVTGLLALGPVAVVLGLVGLYRTTKRGTRGRGLAIAGIVLGALATVAWLVLVAVVVVTLMQTRPLPADVSSPRSAHVGQLVVGNCLATLPPDGEVDTVQVVPCAHDHAARVSSEYDFPQDAVWPGQPAADARVARACVLTEQERADGATVVTWAPTEDGWTRGDRAGLCLVKTS